MKSTKALTQKIHYWDDAALQSKLPRSKANRYLLFDVDLGGLNNIRLVFEYVVAIAAMTGRTLVLPPRSPWYLINSGPLPESERGGTTAFSDIYNIHGLRAAIPVLNTNDFIDRAQEHLAIPENFAQDAGGLDDDADLQYAWRDWLFDHAEVPGWNPHDTVICLPDVDKAKAGPHFNKAYQDGRTPVEFSVWMQAAPMWYFPCARGKRSLGPVATMFADRDDRLVRLSRAVMKHHVRYRDEIFSIALDIVEKLGLKTFDALQIRRNDFQFTKTQVTTDAIVENIQVLFDRGLPIYMATDETRLDVFDGLAKGLSAPAIFSWQDAEKTLKEPVPFAWIGPIEQVICTLARRFVGNDLSTFTAYIHRLRGYHEAVDQNLYFHNRRYTDLPDDYDPDFFKGRTYLRENPLSWLAC